MRLALVGVCSVISVAWSTIDAAAQPDACRVTILRAPDAVREVVESWVRAEPRCAADLEVRIVPTEGGLYLLARDGAGRSRERVVPDAQSAGVLIASWAADDSVATPALAPPGRVDPIAAAPREAPPAMVEAAAPRPRAYSWGGWLTVALLDAGDDGGLRAEADIVETGPLSFGIAGTATHFSIPFGSYGDVSGNDLRVIAYAADTFRQGPVWLRAGLGAGVIYTRSLVFSDTMDYDDAGYSPMAEVSVLVGLNLGQRWALTAGAVATVFQQSWPTGWTGPTNQQVGEVKRVGDIFGMFGVRCRL